MIAVLCLRDGCEALVDRSESPSKRSEIGFRWRVDRLGEYCPLIAWEAHPVTF
jgi:hypothetical protein